MMNGSRTQEFVSSVLQSIVHRCGETRAHPLDGVVRFPPARRCELRLLKSTLSASGLFGDAVDSEDGVCAGGRRVTLPFPFPLRVGALAADYSSPPQAPPQDSVPSMLTMLTLTRFEGRAGESSHLGPRSRHQGSCCGPQA